MILGPVPSTDVRSREGRTGGRPRLCACLQCRVNSFSLLFFLRGLCLGRGVPGRTLCCTFRRSRPVSRARMPAEGKVRAGSLRHTGALTPCDQAPHSYSNLQPAEIHHPEGAWPHRSMAGVPGAIGAAGEQAGRASMDVLQLPLPRVGCKAAAAPERTSPSSLPAATLNPAQRA